MIFTANLNQLIREKINLQSYADRESNKTYDFGVDTQPKAMISTQQDGKAQVLLGILKAANSRCVVLSHHSMSKVAMPLSAPSLKFTLIR